MLTLGVWIFSEEVIDKVIVLPTLAIVVLSLLELMVRLDSPRVVVSIVKELTERLSLTTPLEVTLIVQLSLV